MHICRIAKQGALAAASVSGRPAGSSPEQVELAGAPHGDRAAARDGGRAGGGKQGEPYDNR